MPWPHGPPWNSCDLIKVPPDEDTKRSRQIRYLGERDEHFYNQISFPSRLQHWGLDLDCYTLTLPAPVVWMRIHVYHMSIRNPWLLTWGHSLQNLDLSTKVRQFIEEKWREQVQCEKKFFISYTYTYIKTRNIQHYSNYSKENALKVLHSFRRLEARLSCCVAFCWLEANHTKRKG